MNSLNRKIVATAACVAGALALAGCGESGQSQMSSNPTATGSTAGYQAPGSNSNAGTNGAKNNATDNGGTPTAPAGINNPNSGNASDTPPAATPGVGGTAPGNGGGGR